MARYGRDYRQGMGGGYNGHRPYYPGDDYAAAFGGAQSGYHTGYRSGGYGYDRDLHGRPGGEYDRAYKGRWVTEHGDPFRDRVQHTPIRTMRGEFGNEAPDPGRWRGNEYTYGRSPVRGRYDHDWRR